MNVINKVQHLKQLQKAFSAYFIGIVGTRNTTLFQIEQLFPLSFVQPAGYWSFIPNFGLLYVMKLLFVVCATDLYTDNKGAQAFL
ncbi:MAG: hypothetical protein JO297_01735 [Nitrososphaeraceae archaeon]|nr:hypothetical protein [Nitrososphaeraceae archaeon]